MKKKALLIGVNDYHLLGKLKYAKQDAEAFAGALQDYCGFDKDEISLMSCDAPGAMLAQSVFIERALADLTDYHNLDLLVFGFWGHGFAPEAGKRYLCGTHTMEGELERTAVSLDLVKAKLSQVGAENTLLILDCCQNRPGGRSAAAEALSRGEEQALASIARDIQAAGKKASKFTIPTVAVLNACREGQKAYEWEQREHGIFTAHLLETLSSGCNSVAQLASSIFEPVAKTAHELFRQKQTPCVVIEGKGDITLAFNKSKSTHTKAPARKKDASPKPPARRKKAETQWWYATDTGEEKQINKSELFKLIKSNQITRSTEVWREGLAEWTEAKDCPELATVFSAIKPPKKVNTEKKSTVSLKQLTDFAYSDDTLDYDKEEALDWAEDNIDFLKKYDFDKWRELYEYASNDDDFCYEAKEWADERIVFFEKHDFDKWRELYEYASNDDELCYEAKEWADKEIEKTKKTLTEKTGSEKCSVKSLYQAIENGDVKHIQDCIDAGIDINIQKGEDCNWAPLHWAVYNNREDVVKFLIAQGADLNQVSIYQHESPLHIATFSRNLHHHSIVEYLIDAGVDLNLKTKLGETAISQAALGQDDYLVELLYKAGASTRGDSLTKSFLKLMKYKRKGY